MSFCCRLGRRLEVRVRSRGDGPCLSVSGTFFATSSFVCSPSFVVESSSGLTDSGDSVGLSAGGAMTVRLLLEKEEEEEEEEH